MSMMPRRAASPIRDHHDDDSVENENIEKDFGPPSPKKSKVKEDNSSVPISQDDDDRADREAFDRWRRLVRVEPGGYGEYPDKDEYERRFKYFKDSLRRKVSPEMIDDGINMLQFADRNEQEFKDLTFPSYRKYCYVSHELLDVWEEINSRPHDSCYSCYSS